MNRRRFLQLGTVGLAAATAVAVLPKIAPVKELAYPLPLIPQLLKPEAYATYVMGKDAVLTVADIRKCVEELKSREIKPVNGMYAFPIHHDRVEDAMYYKWKYKWNVAAF